VFANIGWGEMLILVIAGLVILGPERLPGAIRWTSNAVRQARDYVSGATSQLREDLGPEFEDLRQPLSELQKLRGMTPRAALTKHLLDGDDSFLTGNFDRPADAAEKPVSPGGPTPVPPPVATNGAAPADPPGDPAASAGPSPAPTATPFDTDAT
jgi:sec-independent protein translocase protein TatB